ncbi:hypothetical protein R50073_43800 [Maricurvus nonylphenolicus]|uniref:M56 family metallopeptidase n=1 Tax=Maricurvus nonylphenolicus TaxID=1008307 RepID=UPI0036F36069
MIEWFASVALMLLGLWFVLASVLRLVYPAFRVLLHKVSAAQASLLLLLYAALPVVGSIWLVVSLYWPDVARWLVVEHCHSGLCKPHGPVNSLAIVPALLIALFICVRLAQKVRQLYLPAQRLLKQLRFVGNAKQDYIELPEDQVAAFTVGVWQSDIFLSSGLLQRCDEQDIATIVAHEKAHQQRYDNLRRILMSVLLSPLPGTWSRQLIEDHQLMCEKACDQAATRVSDPESVAELIIKLARWQQPSPAYASAFADSHARLRVESLLQSSPQARPSLYGLLVVGVVGLLLLADPLHHLLEGWH